MSISQLTNEQLKYLAEILNNLGIVFMAAMVLPVFEKKLNFIFVFSGLLFAILCWSLGLIILKLKNREEK